jgi:hypothetical protein
MTNEELQLMVHGPSADETKRAAFRQMTSAFRFAYTAWEYAAIRGSATATGAYATYALRNVDEACRLLNCARHALAEKLQAVSDWLEGKGLFGICAPVRTEDGHVCVMKKTAAQLVEQMGMYCDAYIALLKAQKAAKEAERA